MLLGWATEIVINIDWCSKMDGWLISRQMSYGPMYFQQYPCRRAMGCLCVFYAEQQFLWNIILRMPCIILCMHSSNERQCFIVSSSPIGWGHTWNDPCVEYNRDKGRRRFRFQNHRYLAGQMELLIIFSNRFIDEAGRRFCFKWENNRVLLWYGLKF